MMGKLCEKSKPLNWQHTELEVRKKPRERNDEPEAKELIREALSPVSPRQTNGCGAGQANALLWSHIHTVSARYAICLQQSGLGQASRAHSEC